MQKILIPFLLLCLVFTSCSKKTDDAVDLRDQMVGTYTGTTTFTLQWSKVQGITKADTTMTDNETVTVAKSTTSSDVIVLTEKGTTDVSYNGSGITGASNGVGFNILQQSGTIKGVSVAITGNSSYTLGSTKFDGAYTTDNGKKLVYQVAGTYTATVNGIEFKNIPFTYIQNLTKQ